MQTHTHPCTHAFTCIHMAPLLQVDELEHIELEPELLRFTNHSCDPSVTFDTEARTVTAIKALKSGDEVG